MNERFTLQEVVYGANREILDAGLVILTFGNASAVDRQAGVMVIKPSGIPYGKLTTDHMVIVDIESGRFEGAYRPSSDMPTHLELYRSFPSIGAIVHTHSPCATSWAQAGRGIPCFGTTHADHFHGSIPVTRSLTTEEIQGDYERETGVVIVKTFERLQIDPSEMPGVLVAGHGPFAWGLDTDEAVENAIALEAVAAMAVHSLALNPDLGPLHTDLLDRHYSRKHGSAAYYGQRRNQKTPESGPIPACQ